MTKERIYCIHPVRHVTPIFCGSILSQVAVWEVAGHAVRCALRPQDCDQTDDGVGLNICKTHRADVEWSTVCAVWWEGESEGRLFDVGMAFALHRRFWLMDSILPTQHKSFGNVLLAIGEQGEHD